MCVAHIDYACSLFNKCKNGVLKMYVVFAILLIRFLKRHIAARSEFEAAHCRLVAVFVGDEDYFYSVLVTLMSHYDIIVANPVGA